jgi:hypothetical protein
MRRAMSEVQSDRGGAVVSVLWLFPVMMLFVSLIVAGGRVASTAADVQAAAREAARQATLANSEGVARSVTRPIAMEFLADKGIRCLVPSVPTDITPRFEPGAQIEVEVVCVVSIADLGIPGVPGSITVRRSAVEVVDTYRGVD